MFSELILTGAFLDFYMQYNNSKEEFERKKGYPDLSRSRYPGPVGTAGCADPKVINKRVFLARCIYGIYYRQRKHPEFSHWWYDLHYDLVPNIDVLGPDDSKRYHDELKEEYKDLYFGVLRRREQYPSRLDCHGAPKWIVAVRGTDVTTIRDLIHDVNIFLGSPCDRNWILLQAVVNRLVGDHGCNNVLVTGHSLGASAAMFVCRNLAQEGKHVESHLFNPPYATLVEVVRVAARILHIPVNMSSDIQQMLITMRDFIRGAVLSFQDNGAHLVRGAACIREERDRSRNLAGWVPHLYITEHDPVCMLYVEHFTKEAAGRMGNMGEFYLLPRAVLHIFKKLTYRVRPVSAHMLWNWTRPDLEYEMREVNLVDGVVGI